MFILKSVSTEINHLGLFKSFNFDIMTFFCFGYAQYQFNNQIFPAYYPLCEYQLKKLLNCGMCSNNNWYNL